MSGQDFSTTNQECAAKLEDVAARLARSVSSQQNRLEAGPPHLRPHDIKRGTPFEFERLIQFLLRIADAGKVGQLVLCKQPLCFVIRHHVDQRRRDTGRFDFRSRLSQPGERFTAKGSAAVTEKDEENERFV